jgi:hypothetical protein
MTPILGSQRWWGNQGQKNFMAIVDRVEKRLKDWKLKFLSQAGKEVLKAVVQAIPTYSMSVFLDFERLVWQNKLLDAEILVGSQKQ